MNFLGHFYLSKGDPELVVGNFIADFVKGKKYQNYQENIARGIIMHRNIDFFTDGHDMVRLGKKRLFPIYRHYSGVIMDMFYDHFLANLWHQFADESLEEFADDIYKIIESYWDVLPERSQFLFPYMKSGNWIVRYQTIEGVGKSLAGMAHRLNNGSKLEHAVDQLNEYYEDIKPEFEIFMNDIEKHFLR